MRKVQSLYICIRIGTPVMLPCDVFTCNTLNVLQLKGRILINVPSVVYRPKLKTMTLDGVIYQDDQAPFRLISSCTSLESLIIKGVLVGHTTGTFSISSSSLRDIEISFIQLSYGILCSLEIDCPALQRFHISNTSSTKLILFPINLFSCHTLEKLVVHGFFSISAAQIISMPNLKMLEISHAVFDNDETFSKLVSSCTSLESLEIMRTSSNVTESSISSLAIRDLKIMLSSCLSPGHKLVIDAPAVRYLRLIISGCVDSHIENLSSLEEAKIDFYFHADLRFDYYSSAIGNIFQAIQNVKILTINQCPSEIIVPQNLLPGFHRLTTLLINTNRWGMSMLQEVTKKSTKLETIAFKEFTDGDSDKLDNHEICWRNPSRIPTCLLSSLRCMLILFSSGSEDMVTMTKYILENARVLRKMEIHFSRSLENKIKMKLRRNILQARRGSEKCELLMN